jgi:hypothetical protein
MCIFLAAFVRTFPVLNDLGSQMVDNFTEWASIRRTELMMRSGGPEVFSELQTLDDRVQKFVEKMAFLHGMKSVVYRPPKMFSRVPSSIALDLSSGRELSADDIRISHSATADAIHELTNGRSATGENSDQDSIPSPRPKVLKDISGLRIETENDSV